MVKCKLTFILKWASQRKYVFSSLASYLLSIIKNVFFAAKQQSVDQF